MYYSSPIDSRLLVSRSRRARHLGALLSSRRGMGALLSRGLGDDPSFDWTQSTAAPIVQNTSDITAAQELPQPVIQDASTGSVFNLPAPVIAFPVGGSSGTPVSTLPLNTLRMAQTMQNPAIPATYTASGNLIPGTTPPVGPNSLSQWFAQSSIVQGMSNGMVAAIGGGVIALAAVAGGARRRR